MCTYGSSRAAVLAGPYIHWEREQSADAQGLVSKWAEGISVAPRTEEVAGSVVDTLLQIAANPYLRPYIPANAWSWLNERPSLPPTCRGLSSGCDRDIVRTVRALGDIGILTSYLITIWSEWRLLNYRDFVEMQISIRQDHKGIGVCYHRTELIQRLDFIIINQEPPRPTILFRGYTLHQLHERNLLRERMRYQYRELKKALQEMDREATEILNRMPSSFIFLSMLTLMGLHRTLPHLHVCPASPVSVTSTIDVV